MTKTCSEDECDNIVHAKSRCAKCYNREYQTRRVEVKEAAAARGKGTPTWIEQPFEEWRRWRFAKPFLDLEEEIGADVLWGTMVKMCWGGVEPRTAAKVIVLAHMDKAARAGVIRVLPARAA